jgi:preprotein translocase SecE subunit
VTAKEETSGNIATQSVDFLQTAWAELKKVQRPTKQETIQATMVVMFMIFGFAVCLGFIDFVLGRLMQYVLTS